MSITSWLAKRQTKEIIKGIVQAVIEWLEQLLTSKEKIQRKDTARPQTAVRIDNKYPSKYEIEMKQSQDILKGSK